MSKKLFYLLGIVATIILGTLLYLQFCCNCCMPSQKNDDTSICAYPIVTEQDRVPFILNGSGMNYKCNDNLNFLSDNPSLITPVSDSVSLGIRNLKEILIANPKQKITITGYATSAEKNTTKFENLGLARANDVKNFFISQGLPKEKFDTKGKIVTAWQMFGDTLSGPIKFNFNALETTQAGNTDLSSIKEQLNANPLVLYFNTNRSNENLSKDEHQKIIDIVQYVNKTPGSGVMIIGHSDSSGKREANVVLAQKRAIFTKNYLVKSGIPSSRIEIQSKGPDEPIADNETTEGKAKNRRTVTTIK